WHKRTDVSTESRDLFHDARAQVGVVLFRHQKNRFDLVVELSVHQRHLKFEFEIGHRAQPPNHGIRILLACKIDEQPVEARDANAEKLARRLREQLKPLLDSEQTDLCVIESDGY